MSRWGRVKGWVNRMVDTVDVRMARALRGDSQIHTLGISHSRFDSISVT
jgi:hypothetical protein